MVHPILGMGADTNTFRAPARTRRAPDARRGSRPWALVLFAVVAWCALPPGRALAFCRSTTCGVTPTPKSCQRDLATGCWNSGIPLSWTQECLSFSVNTEASPELGLDYDAALAIAQEAFSRWPLATCPDGGSPSIAFMAFAGLTCERVEYNPTGPNANAILFRPAWPHPLIPGALALTTVTFNPKTGQILNADMEINLQNAEVSVDSLPFVITHEAGHFVGLDHAPDPATVMYSDYIRIPGQPFTLTDDDIAAVCDAYPSSRTVPACNFEPPKGYATDCGGDVQAACAVAPAAARDRRAWWWCVLLAAAAAVPVRSRRARAKSRRPPGP